MISHSSSALDITIPFIPGFVTFRHTVTFGRARSQPLSPAFQEMLAAMSEMIPFVLERMASDQLDEGVVSGGWGKGYPDYLRHLFGKEQIPKGVSTFDTISFGSWNATALIDYARRCDEPKAASQILSRVDRFYNYVMRHLNPEDGGFGVGRTNSTGEYGIRSDIRHTVWAVFLLTQLNKSSSDCRDAIHSGTAYLSTRLGQLDFRKEWAITNAALHMAIKHSEIGPIIDSSENSRSSLASLIETALVAGFDENRNCWSLDNVKTSKTELENNLIVLYALDPNRIESERLKAILVKLLCQLESTWIQRGESGLGLPFCYDDPPNVGSSIHALFLMLKHSAIHKPNTDSLSNMLDFASNAIATGNVGPNCFSWQLASLIKLLAFLQDATD